MIHTFVYDFSKSEKKISEKNAERYLDMATSRYIKETKNEEMKRARVIAYSLLFFSLERLFGTRDFSLLREAGGKPYILEKKNNQNINISISHSEHFAAVAISVGEERVGVDLQEVKDRINVAALDKKYFSGARFTESSCEASIYVIESDSRGMFFVKKAYGGAENADMGDVFCEKTEEKKSTKDAESNLSLTEKTTKNNADMHSAEKALTQNAKNEASHLYIAEYKRGKEKDECDFFSKWAAFEAMAKCTGRGIGERKNIPSLLEKHTYSIYKVSSEKAKAYLALAKEKR